MAATIFASLALFAVLGALDMPLRDGEAGVVGFELAGSPERAAEIVGSWEAIGERATAAFQLGLDYLYAPLYAIAIAGACLAVGDRLRRAGRNRIAAAAPTLAWLALAAALFDLIENSALAVSLLDKPVSPWPELALGFASAKFALLALTLGFALAGLLLTALGRGRRSSL